MKLGAQRGKVIFLGVLVALGGYLFYTNVLSGPSNSDPGYSRVTGGNSPAATAPSYPVTTAGTRRRAFARGTEEFRPSMKVRPEDHLDPMSIDPTLRLDLLAKVQAVDLQGGNRNLFQFSTPPPPPLPKEPVVKPKTPDKVASGVGVKPAAAGPPPPPAAPPILLKYYGYSSVRGDPQKRAFFLDGDDILVAREGDIVKKRYRVVRIGINSVVMEDTQFKHEQTLPLLAEATG
jgi:hypothetical protein